MFFRFLRSLAVSLIFSLFFLGSACCGDDEKRTTEPNVVSAVDEHRIEQLIQQLGNPSFAIRQSAMHKIWRIGNEAKPLLHRFENDEDQELAARAKRLLEYLELGISPGMQPELADSIIAFHKGNENQRFEILDQLRTTGRFRLTLDLIHSITDREQKYYLCQRVYPSGESLTQAVIGTTANAEAWMLADQLMNHPVLWEYHADDCALYFYLRNQSDQHIDKLAAVCLGADTASDELRNQLIAHCRMIGNYPLARQVAQQLTEFQEQTLEQLLLEEFNWSLLAELYSSEPAPDLVSGLNTALSAYWSGDRERYEAAISRIRKQFDSAKSVDELVNLHLLTADTEWLLRHVDKIELTSAFRLLCQMNRFDEAFALTKAPRDKAERAKWFAGQLDLLQGYIQEVVQDFDQDGKAKRQFEFCLEFAVVTGSLGNHQEALELIDGLIDAIRIDDDYFQGWNEEVFEQLARLDIGHRVWEYFQMLEMEDAGRQVFSVLFPNSRNQAQFWYTALQDAVPDAFERIRLIAGITRSAYDPRQIIDMEQVLSVAHESLEKMPIRMRRHQLLALAETLSIHGNETQAHDLRKEAGYLGNVLGFSVLAEHAVGQQRPEEAADWYHQALQIGGDPYVFAFCSRLARGETTASTDPLSPEMRNDLLCCLNSDELTLLSREATNLNRPDVSIKLLRLYLTSNDLLNSDNDYYQRQLGILLTDKHPGESADRLRRASYAYFHLLDPLSPNIAFHHLSSETHFSAVRSLMNQGQYEQAKTLLRRLMDFVSGNSELAEEFVPAMEAAGHQEFAEELFAGVADRYLNVIEAYPNSATHHNNYAWVCAQCHRRIDEAKIHAEQAVKLSPNHTSYLDTLAEIVFQSGETERAVELATRCVELNPYKEHYRQQLQRFRRANNQD